MGFERSIDQYFANEYDFLRKGFGPPFRKDVQHIAELVYLAWRSRKYVWIIGNGGSSETANHFALDLAKYTRVADFPGVRAISLMAFIGNLTAWSNDDNFIFALERQVQTFANDGDLLIAISTSGLSGNLGLALKAGREAGTLNVGLYGPNRDVHMVSDTDVAVFVDLDDIRAVEDLHLKICHAIAGGVRSEILDLLDDVGLAIADQDRSFGSLSSGG